MRNHKSKQKQLFVDGVKTSHLNNEDTTPFENAQEAWFWFMAAQKAKNEGAKFVAGAGLYKRPCEPVDILKILDRLHRNRMLHRDHLLVLRHYGRRHMAPDPYRAKEKRGYHLWNEALDKMGDVLIAKGIVEPKQNFDFPAHIANQMSAYQGTLNNA
ncbi:MAG: hypothetical protein AB8B83_07235 [Bdellovibrionales bacterium]